MCGIFGAIGTSGVRDEVLAGIELLQHRGQEAAGLLLVDPAADQHFLVKRTGGLANLPPEKIGRAEGTIGVAHLRYNTTGDNEKKDAQPFWTDDGNMGFVHNGQVINMAELREKLESRGKRIVSTSDGELLLKTFASFYREANGSLEDRVFAATRSTQQAAIGGYSCLLPIYGVGLLAFRDPWGFRPMVMGHKENGNGPVVAFASESCTLKKKGYSGITDVPHGGAVLVRENLAIETRILEQRQRSNCALEYVYFGDSSSVMEGSLLNDVRYNLGKLLARKYPSLCQRLDMVVPIPESPRPAASGFAMAGDVLYKDVIYKSRHVKRIFITPGQQLRDQKANEGFNYDEDAFDGKIVGLVDDSIMRGTNSKAVVEKVRSFGAKEVYGIITFPPTVASCPAGIDIPNNLVATGRSMDEIARELGFDGIVYATPEDMYQVLGRRDLCLGCVTGKYPTDGLVRIT